MANSDRAAGRRFSHEAASTSSAPPSEGETGRGEGRAGEVIQFSSKRGPAPIPATGSIGMSFRMRGSATVTRSPVRDMSPAPTPIPMVDVVTLIRGASSFVFLICALSMLMGVMTGFYMIYPPMSVLIAAIAILFYLISVLMRRRWKS